jgi:hypothetical protein
MLGGVKDGEAYRYHIGEPVGRLEVIADMEAQFKLPCARRRRRQNGRVSSSVRIGAGLVEQGRRVGCDVVEFDLKAGKRTSSGDVEDVRRDAGLPWCGRR